MGGNDHGEKSEVRPKRTVLSPNTMSTVHYIKTLSNGKQDSQGSGNQPDGASGNSSGSQGSEKKADDKS